MADYKPPDCQPPCKYPAITLGTGSGHARGCPAHQRWVDNGNSWRVKSEADQYRHTHAAQEIVERLIDRAEGMNEWERDFLESMSDRFDRFGCLTFVTDSQMGSLRRLDEKYK